MTKSEKKIIFIKWKTKKKKSHRKKIAKYSKGIECHDALT